MRIIEVSDRERFSASPQNHRILTPHQRPLRHRQLPGRQLPRARLHDRRPLRPRKLRQALRRLLRELLFPRRLVRVTPPPLRTSPLTTTPQVRHRPQLLRRGQLPSRLLRRGRPPPHHHHERSSSNGDNDNGGGGGDGECVDCGRHVRVYEWVYVRGVGVWRVLLGGGVVRGVVLSL